MPLLRSLEGDLLYLRSVMLPHSHTGKQAQHRLQQLLASEWLAEKILNQLLGLAIVQRGLGVGRDEEDRQVGPAPPQVTGDVGPTQVGKPQVEHDDVGPVDQQRQRLGAACCWRRGKSFFSEDTGDEAANLRLVVYHD